MERAAIIRIMKEEASCRDKVAWVREAPKWPKMYRWSVVVFTARTMEDNSVAVDLEVCLVDLGAADQMIDLNLRIKALSRKFTWAILTRM